MKRIMYFSMGKENRITEAEWKDVHIVGVRLQKQETQIPLWERIKRRYGRKKMLADIRKLLGEEPYTGIFVKPGQEKETETYLGSIMPDTLNPLEQRELLMAYLWDKEKVHYLEEVILDTLEDGESVQNQEWFAGIWNNLNYFTVITENPEAFEGLEKLIYEDTGLMLQYAEDVRRLEPQLANRRYHRSRKCLWLDFSGKPLGAYRCMPRNCIFVDGNSSVEKERYLSVKRPDISYFSFMKLLDTILSGTV